MNKFDIIVKDKSDSFICPSVIAKEYSSFKSICENHISGKTYSRSPWLYLVFDFLPPALYNHLLVFCMRDLNFEKPKLFYEIGLFSIKGSNDLDKFFLCKSRNTISLQIFSKRKTKAYDFELHSENIPNAQTLLENMLDKIRHITNKYRFTVHCKPKIACFKADYSSKLDGYYLEEIQVNSFGNCTHCQQHDYSILSSIWFKVSNVTSLVNQKN